MKKINLSTEQIKEYAASSSDKTELATKLGFTYCNGKVIKIIDVLILEHSLDVNHFNRYNKNKRKYPKINKVCPICSVEFETLLGWSKEKSTCSTKCANTFFKDKIHSSDSKMKVSESLKKYNSSIGKIYFTMYKGKRIYRKVSLKKKCNFCGADCKNI